MGGTKEKPPPVKEKPKPPPRPKPPSVPWEDPVI